MSIKISGLDISYSILGNGKPFLVLHGWGSKKERWIKTAEIISQKGFSVVVPDLPGFGESQLPSASWSLDNYCDFLDSFIRNTFPGSQKVYLLGHSFGGALAAKFSLKYPERIEGLFLVASACIRKKTAKKKFLPVVSKALKVFSFIPFARKAFYKFIVGKSDYLSVEGVLKETYLKVISEDLSQSLSSITVPTTIIWGDKDEATPIEDAYLINKKISNSKLVTIPGGTHNLEIKMPETLAQKILDNI